MSSICAGLGGAWERLSCELRSVTTGAGGCLATGTWHTEARCILFGVSEPLRAFRKVCSMRPFIWKSHWKRLGWAFKLVGLVSHGITRTGRMVLARLVETEIWWLSMSAHCVGGQLNKWTVASASTSIWEKASPPALTLKPDNSVPSHMSVALLKLMLQCWRPEQANPLASKSMYGHPNRNSWDASCLLS